VLTFQAGAEVDGPQLVREWKASVSIGLVSFSAPFAVVALVTYYALDWSRRQAAIAQRFYQPDSAVHRDLTAPVAPAPAD
jgi:Kef-type K+ transport system membrane component KefB